MPGDGVTDVEKTATGFKVQARSGRVFEVDGVVAGIGIRPNVELAGAAGLQIENGIVVDDHLRTSAADVYAVGDVALFPHPTLGKMTRWSTRTMP